MSDYDGSIKIDTKIDTKNVSSQMLRLENQISKTARKASELTDKMRQMENAKIPTEDYKDISDALHKSTAEFDKLLQRQEEMVARGKTSGAAWDSLDRKIEKVGADIRAAQKYQSQMVKEGTAYLDKGAIRASDAYQKLKNQLRDTNGQMQTLTKKQEELAAKENKVSNSADKARRSTGSWLDSFSSRTKRTNGLLHNLATRLRGIALSMFIFNWITKGWNAMLSAIKAGTQNMAKYSSDVNAKMSALVSAVATLKNAFGALAAPIISAVGPALTYLINMLTAAINKVNQFISALTGKSTWTKATTQVKDYAAGLDKAANSAKKLKGQLQSFDELNNLSSNDGNGSGGSGGGGNVSDMFEEVPIDQNIADLADKIKEAIASGDWEGLGEFIGDEIEKALKKIDWDKAYVAADGFGIGLALFLNGLISPDLFGEVGKTIASALNTAIYFALAFGTTFDFYGAGESIAEGINEFFLTFDFDALADTVNAWVDGLWNFVIGFIDNLRWPDIFNGLKDFLTELTPQSIITILGLASGGLAPLLSSAISNILGIANKGGGKNITLDGVGLAILLGTIAFTISDKNDNWKKTLLETIVAGYAGFRLSGGNLFFALAGVSLEVGIHIGKFLVEHSDDMKRGIKDLKDRIRKGFMDHKTGHDETGKETTISVPVTLSTFFNWDESGSLFDDMLKNFKTAFDGNRTGFMDFGGYIFEGIIDGFLGAAMLVAEPIKDFFTWLGNGICEVFGIHSPAKKMKPYGKNIFLGIIEGWKEKVSSFSFSKYAKTLFTKIKKEFSNLKDNYVEFEAKIKDKASDLWEGLKKDWNSVKDKVANFKSKIETKASDLWGKLKKDWNGVKDKVADFKTKIASDAGDLWSKFQKKWKGVKNKIAEFKAKVSDSSSPAKLWDSFSKSWSSRKKTVSIGIGFVKNSLSNLWNSVSSFFGGKKVSVGTQTAKKANGGIYTGGMWHNITKYAMGTENAPTGQLFIAREAGPELVGTIGGHTSVVNNDQIVASVSDGVARAVRSVIGTNGSNVNVTFKVEGDPNGIFRVTQQKANEYFHATGNPAFEF